MSPLCRLAGSLDKRCHAPSGPSLLQSLATTSNSLIFPTIYAILVYLRVRNAIDKHCDPTILK